MTCKLDQNKHCARCAARFLEVLEDIHTHECHVRPATATLTERLSHLLRRIWRQP